MRHAIVSQSLQCALYPWVCFVVCVAQWQSCVRLEKSPFRGLLERDVMPHKQSQAASHCPHAYTRGSKPNIRYSKSIHATAQPYRRLGRASWPGQAPMCERASRDRARLCDHRALQAAYHRTQLGADTTTAPKMGAKLPAQGTQGRSEAIAHERHNARAQAHTHHRTTTSTASAPALAAVARSQGCRAPRRSRLPHMPHL